MEASKHNAMINLLLLLLLGIHSDVALALSATPRPSLWKLLEAPDAWKTVFGENGQRGEYMDGYSSQAMLQRCREDYFWNNDDDDEILLQKRAQMMVDLYDHEPLWTHVCMVAFAEHYVLGGGVESQPFRTFYKHQLLQSEESPIFGGVVYRDWQEESNIKLSIFQKIGVDYVRLECNFGTAEDIGSPENLSKTPKFEQLANVAKTCQSLELVPLILIQVPWKESRKGDENVSLEYYDTAIQCLAKAFEDANVESNRILLETRPPMGVSVPEERNLSAAQRVQLGLETGQAMFQTLQSAFSEKPIAGFCVAGGSTKGAVPTAMEDDTQNAVRQGMRECARETWNYDACFWEMGAKLLLQPEVGQLWADNPKAARDLFCSNAQALAKEIQEPL